MEAYISGSVLKALKRKEMSTPGINGPFFSVLFGRKPFPNAGFDEVRKSMRGKSTALAPFPHMRCLHTPHGTNTSRSVAEYGDKKPYRLMAGFLY